MHYTDTIYGLVEITEPLLIQLIESDAVQRLHGVLQHGISGLIGLTAPITRFDHSMGAMLLVRRMGAGLEEQAAALLHDVSHTAFSHVIDYVFDDYEGQGYHDRVKAEYVAGTDLPPILESFGCDWRKVIDEELYPLLEQPSPRLCADRLDYFLRDTVPLGLASAADVQRVLDHIIVFDGRLMTDNLDVARWMADTFIAADDASWANFKEVGLYELAAQAIQRGFDVGALRPEDVWLTDRIAWGKLVAHSDATLQQLIALVRPETRFVWDEEAPTFTVYTKIRTIVPDVVVDGVARPLSEWDSAFAERRAAYLARKSGTWPMRVMAMTGADS